jgi:Holliday junction resolvase RusA-like endonuclease
MLANMLGPIARPDTTNYQKLYEDCLIGIVIDDDAGVTRIISEKKYSEKPGVLIKLFKYEELYPEIEDNSII